MSDYRTVARPYAKAAFDFSVEHRCIEHWQRMLVFIAEVVSNKQIRGLLSASEAPQKLSDLLLSVCGEHIDEAGQNFIRVTAENRRLLVIPAILEQFIRLRYEYEKTKEVEVISSFALSSDQIEKIRNAMEKRLLRKVVLNCKVDNSMIAGLIIRVDETVIDGSLRNRLQRLENFLLS